MQALVIVVRPDGVVAEFTLIEVVETVRALGYRILYGKVRRPEIIDTVGVSVSDCEVAS